MATPILQVLNLHGGYGESQVLHGVSFDVHEGELVTVLGRNGAGRSTTLKALLGLVKRTGQVRIHGVNTQGLPPYRIARLGVGYCPEERGIFASLSAAENLVLPPVLGSGGIPLGELHGMFPMLQARANSQGTRLSGGEQQMLAVARILRTGARLLLLDEISEGLAPVIVQALARTIASLKQRGYTILMVEQNFHFAAALADRFVVMEHGRVVQDFLRTDLPSHMASLQAQLRV